MQRLRGQRHPHRRAAALPRREPEPGAHGVRVGNRLLEPLPPLHGDLRLPRDPRACVPGRRGDQDGAARPRRVRQHRRRRLLQHRRGPLDSRRPLQHEPDGAPARQLRVRAHQEAGVADLAARPQEQHDAARRVSRAAQPTQRHARRAERLVRRAGGGLDPGRALRHRRGRVRAQRVLVRADRPALPGVPARDARSLAARSVEDAAVDPRERPGAQPRPVAIYKNRREHDPLDIDRAREIASSVDPIPVGILYRNPDVPCYEDLRRAGEPRPAERIRAGLEAELDRFTVWPEEEPA